VPRNIPQAAFEKRTNRIKKLAANKDHWHPCDENVYVGYRRSKTKSVWMVRRYIGNRQYKWARIGLADDYQEADGENVLTFFQAQDRAKQLARDAARQEKPLPKRSGYTVTDAFGDYIEWYRAEKDKAAGEYERIFNRDIKPKLGACPVADLTRKQLKGWRTGLIKQKPRDRSGNILEVEVSDAEMKRRRKSTAQRKWTILRAILNHAFSEGEVASDAEWRSVKPLRDIDAPPPTRALTVEECRLVTSKLEDDFRPIAQATYLTGAAFKELRRKRLVPLTDEGQRFFDGLTAGKEHDALIFTDAKGQPWGKSAQTRRMQDASKAAKITPPITLTELRHAYGSLLLNAGVSLEVLSKSMGHASTSTTAKHYAHLLQKTVDDPIREKLPTAKHYAHLLQKTVDDPIREKLPTLGIEQSTVTRLRS
jgi:integrase